MRGRGLKWTKYCRRPFRMAPIIRTYAFNIEGEGLAKADVGEECLYFLSLAKSVVIAENCNVPFN